MERLNWTDVRDDWLPNDGLRDIYVGSATLDDWQRVLDVVRARGWPATFSVNGGVTSMPTSVEPIFELVGKTILWQFLPHPDVTVHGHFFAVDEIELDVDPREVVGQEQFDAVCEVVRVIGRALGKPVEVTVESAHSDVLMRYDPSTDILVHLPGPPGMSVWDRLSGGG